MEHLKNFFNGIIIGIANIIPGVSGGTMALVLGFYERFIEAIHNISIGTIKISFGVLTFKKKSIQKFKKEFKQIDGIFLSTLVLGALISIVALANLMKYLINNWYEPTYGFFFGLVFVSAIAPYRMIKKITITTLITTLIAASAIFLISNILSNEEKVHNAKIKYKIKLNKENSITLQNNNIKPSIITDQNYRHMFYLFLAGAISISAMILPGVSGSFLLLLMGIYFEILTAIAEKNFIVLMIFGAGCLVGIAFFTRLLNYLLDKWRDISISFLLGLVIGSLWLIWPFKNSVKVGEETIYLSNKLPDNIGTIEIYTIITLIAGMGIVAVFIYLESKRAKQSQ